MEINKSLIAFFLAFLILVSSCKTYTSNVILKTDSQDLTWSAAYEKTLVAYSLRPGDKFQFTLYTNLGEAIIDPSGKLVSAATSGSSSTTSTNTAVAGKPVYEVSEAGTCFFPVIGKLTISGLKISELDSLLSAKYEELYNEVYVVSKVTNKRIVVLGSQGGKIIPFENSNLNLLEVIATYGGLDNKAKGYNIRVLRGDLKNPEVQVVNLKTIGDMKSSIVRLQPDDIVYIETVRKPFSEGLQDNMMIFQVVNIIFTLTILVERLATI